MITPTSCCRVIRASLVYAATTVAAYAAPVTIESVPQDAVDRTRLGGYLVTSGQFLGWRFEVDQPFGVTAVGGNFSLNGELFAALVPLSGPSAVPLGSPFLPGEVIAATTFNVVGFHRDVMVPLSVSLTPGVYGLVFGSGAFGADGRSTMSFLVGDPLSDPAFFGWPAGSSRWVGSARPTRFFVVGEPVPDSSPGLAGVLALIALFTWQIRNRVSYRV